MKIILACGIFPPDIGGPATYADKLAGEMGKLGHEVAVLTYGDRTNEKLKMKNEKSFDGLRMVSEAEPPQSKIKNDGFPVFTVARRWPKGIRHFVYFCKLLILAARADVIYVQNAVSAGVPAALVAGILRKKLVLKVVGDAAWERASEQGKTSNNLEEFQNKSHSLAIDFLSKTQCYVSRKADAIIVPSVYLKNIVQGWGIHNDKIIVIYNSLTPTFSGLAMTKEEARKKLGIGPEVFMILSVGRLVPWKGFSALIEIMPALLRENPSFELDIVGEGEEREKLESKLREQEGSMVRFKGMVEHADIAMFYIATDALILNSGYEGLSHSILEAMQFGRPVITSNKGGNPELIEDEVNGLLIEYNNKEQIKEAILKIWRDKALQEKFVANSLEKLKKFSFEAMIEQTLTVLSK